MNFNNNFFNFLSDRKYLCWRERTLIKECLQKFKLIKKNYSEEF